MWMKNNKPYLLEINFYDVYTQYSTQRSKENYLKNDELLGNIPGYICKLIVCWK
jgi:hypothetical protein